MVPLFSSVEFHSWSDLFRNQIEDLYDAENRLTKALPKMAEAAHSVQLKHAFEQHMAETRSHVLRLETIFRDLNIEATGETCEAMKSLIAECAELMVAKAAPELKDAALIAAAQRVEHYEMAGYGTARTFAQRLGLATVANCLGQTLNEETEAEQKLTTIAEAPVTVQPADNR